MNPVLHENDYKNIFNFFTEISAIPRGSKNDTQISNYLVDFAKKRGLQYNQDELKNVIIIKEASSGYEAAPAVIIQGHMDMVCEKTKESTHDFLTQGLELLVDGDFVYADGTTLGADDGIALAYTLALLDDDTVKHPRIEAVFTIDEEIGMEGAAGIDVSELKGKYLFNIDSEEEESFLTSAAGGFRGFCKLPVKRVAGKGLKINLSISNLLGGHSGTEIDKNRVNATKLMGRLLFELKQYANLGLIQMTGGTKDNAITRDTTADIFLFPEDLEEFQNGFDVLKDSYKNEFLANEPDLTIQMTNMGEGDFEYLHPTSFQKLLFLLINTPHGVQTMSSNIPGLVESSLNLGIFNLDEEKAEFCFLVRSSVNSYTSFIENQLSYITQFLGGDYETRAKYPSWEYKHDSKLRDIMKKTFIEEYGHEPKFEAIHAGLECGFFAEKIPGVDIVSFGPNIYDIHTPKERMSISSTLRVYKYIEKLIESMKE